MSDQAIQPGYSASDSRYRAGRSLHIAALLTTVCTFPLIFIGGLVTSHHAGMSVPDWPNSYGYNMFLFPPSQWVGGILYEHTHRLSATVVGFCAVVLTLLAWGAAERPQTRRRLMVAIAGIALAGGILALAVVFFGRQMSVRLHDSISQGLVSLLGLDVVLLIAFFARHREPRRWVRWLATAVLGAVLFQGLLGGLRVVLVQLDLAIVHACVAQAFFCLAAFTALVTSRWWMNAPDFSGDATAANGRRLAYLGVASFAVIYLQLVVGALMRHFDAGLAIPDFPLSYGKILPPLSQAAMDAINHHRTFDLGLDRVTLGQVWLHFAHRLGAVAVSTLVLALTIAVFRNHRRAGLLTPAVMLLGLLLAQVTLGALTVLMRKPADVASTHVAVGALVLMSCCVLTARALRLYQPHFRGVLRSHRPGRLSSPTRPVGLQPVMNPS